MDRFEIPVPPSALVFELFCMRRDYSLSTPGDEKTAVIRIGDV